MATHRNLIDYLPLYMQQYIEIKAIMDAEQPEINDLDDSLESVWNDQFIADATENGVSRRENILGITPKVTDTLDERKFRILAMLNQELPYTMTKLEEVLTTLCGAGEYTIYLDENNYHITVEIGVANINSYNEIEKILKKMIPANMEQLIQIKYNTYEVLSEYTHSELSVYTHEQLRSGVIS